MKKDTKLLTAVLASTMLVSLASCNESSAQKEQAFVSLDINPSIELVLDTNNQVLSVYAANEDAQVLLYAEENLIGLDVDVAVEKITQLAIELGYLSEENSVINTSVISLKGEKNQSSLEANVQAKLVSSASSLGLDVSTKIDGNFSLQRKLAALKEKYPNDSTIQNITIEKFKLALSASETGEITLEAAVKLDNEELIKIIQDAHQKIEVFATDAYNFAKAQALNAFEQAAGLAIDGIYSTYYLKNIQKHPTTFYYGYFYQMYQFASMSFDAIADAAEYANKIANTSLNEEQVAQVIRILNLDESTIDEIKDGQGNITIKSIDAYANKLFKNSELNAELEKMADDLSSALNETESIIEAKLNELQEEYADEINVLITSVEGIENTLKAMLITLPDSVKEVINACVAEFDEIAAELKVVMKDGLTISKIREYAQKMEAKAADMLTKIENDLSDEELAEVNQIKADVEAKFQSAKEKMEKAIKQAEDSAKTYFAQLKENRRQLKSA